MIWLIIHSGRNARGCNTIVWKNETIPRCGTLHGTRRGTLHGTRCGNYLKYIKFLAANVFVCYGFCNFYLNYLIGSAITRATYGDKTRTAYYVFVSLIESLNFVKSQNLHGRVNGGENVERILGISFRSYDAKERNSTM